MFKLSAQEISESYGAIKKALNSDVLEQTQELADVVVPHKDENRLLGDIYEQCKQIQSCYNDSFYPSVSKLLEAYQGEIDIAEWLDKASVGDIQMRDVSFNSETVDPDAVMA